MQETELEKGGVTPFAWRETGGDARTEMKHQMMDTLYKGQRRSYVRKRKSTKMLSESLKRIVKPRLRHVPLLLDFILQYYNCKSVANSQYYVCK